MRRENELIISLIMCRHNDKISNHLEKLITESLDWEYISYQIIMNRIAGVVAENLSYCNALRCVPKSIGIYLFDTYTAIQHRFNCYKQELKLISEALENNEISYVTIKGIHLSYILYDFFRMNPRDFSDLDIVVPKDKLDKVGEILRGLGYEHARINFYTNELEKIKRSEILSGKMFYHQIPPHVKKFEPYFIARNTLQVDTNYTIFEGGQHEDPIPMKTLLDSRIPQNMDGIKYYSLKPEHDLIQNCFHFYKDIMYPAKNKRKDVYKLINFYDIFLFIEKYRCNLDFTYLLNMAKSNIKLEQSLYIVLSLTQRVFGNLKIDKFLSQLNNAVPEYLANIFNLDIETIIFQKKEFV